MPVSPGDPPPPRSTEAQHRRSSLIMLLIWLAGAGAAWLAADWYLTQSQQVQAMQPGAAGEWVIARGRDGHFRVPGTVNGVPLVFMVDTGASDVSVPVAVARQAGLEGGRQQPYQTANGTVLGEVYPNVRVGAGELVVARTRVSTGLQGLDDDLGLLGQSFLRHFEITISGNRMTLRRPDSRD